MKNLIRIFVVAFLLVGATVVSGFGQGMVYQTHQEMTLAAGEGLSETWVQLPSNDYVRATHNGTNSVVETAEWTVNIQGGYWPCIAQYDGTVWCAVRQTSTSTLVVGSFTFSPTGIGTVVLIKISSSGSVLNAWQATGSMSLFNISVKNNSEIAVIGSGSTAVEHLTSPNGGGVVLIHNGNDWDVSKGFFIEAPSGAGNPRIMSAQYLLNGHLVLAGHTDGGTVSFGGITDLPAHGGKDGFRGEITNTGVGITAVQMASSADDLDNIQITKVDGSFMVTGTYNTPITFYNADGTVGGSLGQFPTGCSHDNVYFAYYNASGIFQNAEVAYNSGCTTDMLNIDLVYGNNAFYAMIGNTNGGTATTPTGTHDKPAPIILKFDNTGTPVWSKQVEGLNGSNPGQYGEEILVQGDVVTLTGVEGPGCNLNFDITPVISVVGASYWCEYFDGTVVGPTADFSGTPTTLVQGQSVTFTDASIQGTNPITSWTWTFQGGNPGTYSGQNPPAISYSTAGTYDVTLVVSDGSLSDTELKADYITVIAPTLSLSPTSANVTAAAGTTSFSVLSNMNWTATETASWVTIAPASGNGNGTVVVTYQANTTTSSRTCVVTVTAGSLTQSFTLSQAGTTPILSISPTSANVTASAGSTTTAVTSNVSWSISGVGSKSGPSWYSVSPMSGIGNDLLTITYGANISPVSRSDSFTVSGEGETAIFNLFQYQQGVVIQTITLPQGWSGISSYVAPNNTSIQNMFAPVEGNMIILQNDEGTYQPNAGVNTLQNWNDHTGYLIKMENTQQLNIVGAMQDVLSVNLSAGWNYLPVLVSCPLPVNELFAPIADKLQIVKEIAGYKMYWPEHGINTLQTVLPQKAYFILVSNDVVLEFPACNAIPK